MRLACLYLPGFAIQVERRANPTLCGVPLMIGGYHHESGRVQGVSSEAAGFGVVPDMPLRQAYRLCPGGTFLPYREERYRQAFSSVACEVAQLCPLVEPEPLAHILLGLRYERDGLRFAGEVMAAVERHLGFQSSCGIAPSRFAARAAAEDAPLRQVVVCEGSVGYEYLSRLPVERLPLAAGTKRRLRLLGIVSAGDLLQLPAGAVEAQLGQEGRTLLCVVRGEDNREVEQWQGARELTQHRCFDVPATHGGELLQAVRDLLDALCGELEARWQCCHSLSLALELESGSSRQEVLHFKQPSSSASILGQRLISCVERLAGEAAVTELRLTAFGLCGNPGTQSSFLDGLPRATRQFHEAVGVLQQRYGPDVVQRLVPRHGGRLPEERYSFVPHEVEVR